MTKKIAKCSLVLGLVAGATLPVVALVSCDSDKVRVYDKGEITDVYGVTDGGLKNDKSFNNQAYDAVKWFSGKDQNFIEVKDSTGIKTAYGTVASKGGKLIVASGFAHDGPISDSIVDPSLNSLNWLFIDGTATKSDANRVLGIQFSTQQVGALAGYIAADYAEKHNKKVATFGGMDIPAVTDYMYGFVSGVMFFNQEHPAAADQVKFVKPSTQFIGTFEPNRNSAVSNLTAQLVKDGADVIFPVGGPQQQTVLKEIKNSPDVRVIGVDADFKSQQNGDTQILTSALKNIATVTTAALEVLYGKNGAQAFNTNATPKYMDVSDATKSLFSKDDFWGVKSGNINIKGGLAENIVGLPGDDAKNLLGDNETKVEDYAKTLKTPDQGVKHFEKYNEYTKLFV